MTSPTPLLYDTYYHIFNRGVDGENIFIEERNYDHFLNLLQKYIAPVAEIFAYCMLRNHFHILIRTCPENLVKNQGSLKAPSVQFSYFFNAYAKAINKAYEERTGSLFQHPFGRIPITNPNHFYRSLRYIHQNPQRHGLIEDFRQWKYSSYGSILAEWHLFLQLEALPDWFGSREQFVEFHLDMEPLLEGDFKTNPNGF